MSDGHSFATNYFPESAGGQASNGEQGIADHDHSANQGLPMTGRSTEMQEPTQTQRADLSPLLATSSPENNAQRAGSPWANIAPATALRPFPGRAATNSHGNVPPSGVQPPYPSGSPVLENRHSAETQVALKDLQHISHSVRASSVRVGHLDAILRAMHLSRNGVKKVKVERLLFAAQQYFNTNNFESLHHMRHVVDSLGPAGEPAGAPQRVRPMTYTEAVNSISSTSSPAPATAPNPLVSPKKSGSIQTPLSFQKSPFYSLEYPIATPMFFMRPYTRRRVQQTSRFRINQSMLLNDTNRIYLVSQHFIPQAQNLRPVYFPFYIDITLDGQEVKANTRGVRGSVGSAKPVDLTSYLKGKAGNSIRSLTVTIHISDQNQYETVSDKSFAMGLYMGHKTPFAELISLIKEKRPHFTIEQTKHQLHKAAAEEEDIESTAMRFSLRDPVMRARIKEPIRSRLCEHIDCFDAESFFMLQNQAETWKCPVCNRRITFDSLLFDEFYMDILNKTPDDLDAVEIASDGKWSIPAHESDSGGAESSDGDGNVPASKRTRTEPEVEVIDLLSDTDEEAPEPVKPVSPRGSFQSEQAPRNPDTTNTSSNIQEPSRSGSGRELADSRQQNGTSTHDEQTEISKTQGSDTQNGMNKAEQSNAQPETNDSLANTREVSNIQDNQSSSSEPPGILPHLPSSALPQQLPEPRFQIAQMLQSFRTSNSVLFQKSLPYPSSYGLFYGNRSSEQAELERGQSSTGEENRPDPIFSTSAPGQPYVGIPSIQAEGPSLALESQTDLSDEDVIDLTGDD